MYHDTDKKYMTVRNEYIVAEWGNCMKKIKTLSAVFMIICVLLSMTPQTVSADSIHADYTAKTSGSGNPIQVKSVSYEEKNNGMSEIEIDFLSRVTWKKSAKVSSVKDNKGNSYTGYLLDKDDDDCEIGIENFKDNRTYTIVINGIKKRGTDSYRKLTLKVKIPSKKSSSDRIKISKVSVDDDASGEIDVRFANKVTWKKTAKVTSVKDNKGKSYKGYLTDKDDDDCEIFIANMKYNRTYTIKISGVKARGASSYKTLTVKVKVPAQSNNLKVKEVEYDMDYENGSMEYTVSFEFNKDVVYKNSSYILIEDTNGKAYSSRSSYIDWDDDECEVFLSSELEVGKTYSYKIVNVKAAGADKYTTLKGNFTAY